MISVRSHRGLFLVLLLVATATGLVAASRDSFWMDEFSTLHFAEATGVAGFFRRLLSWKWSEAQMPLYLFEVWGWSQLFGTGEWTLRLLNVPWFVLGAAGILYWFRHAPAFAAAAVLALCLSPFAWYYIDEARPYAPLLSASCWMLGLPLSALGRSPGAPALLSPTAAAFFLAGSFLSCALHLLAVPWFGSSLLCLAVLMRSGAVRLTDPRRTLLPVLLFLLPLAILAWYYVHTILQGSRARITPSNPILNAGFSLYELLGFAGLGPNRFELRSVGIAALGRNVLPVAWLAAALAALALLWLKSIRNSLSGSHITAAACLLLPPFLFLIFMNVALDFRFLGRHLAPAAVVVAVWLASAFRGAVATTGGKFAAGQALLLLVASCLVLRFHPLHANEDYQGAAALARTELEAGRHVWWLASPKALEYHGLQSMVPDSNFSENLTSPLNPAPGALLRTGFDVTLLMDPNFNPPELPDVMFISRPSDYDPAGVVRNHLTQSGYKITERLHIFDVYRPAAPSPD